MYVRVATAEIKPGMLGDLSNRLVDRYQNPPAGSQPPAGFLGHQFMLNRETNKIAIISRWDSAESEAQDRQGTNQQTVAQLGDYFANRPVIEGFELAYEG